MTWKIGDQGKGFARLNSKGKRRWKRKKEKYKLEEKM
jgi:hypothetical protein